MEVQGGSLFKIKLQPKYGYSMDIHPPFHTLKTHQNKGGIDVPLCFTSPKNLGSNLQQIFGDWWCDVQIPQ